MKYTTLHPIRWHSQTWYEAIPGRLVLESKAMETRFPDFQLVRDGTQLVWMGTLETNRGNRYEIALYYPDNFPDTPPKVFPINPVLEVYKSPTTNSLKHQYNDGSLCLHFPADQSFGTRSTAATVIAVAAAWLFAYETWLDSGKTEWPGDEAD